MFALPYIPSAAVIDVGVFKSLKSAFNKACKRYMAENPGCVVRSEILASVGSCTATECHSSQHHVWVLQMWHLPSQSRSHRRPTNCPLEAVGGKVIQEEPDSPTLSSINRVDSTPGSGLNTVSPPSQSHCSESSGSELLRDILFYRNPKREVPPGEESTMMHVHYRA